MPELLLELFSEEIPARMQARAADDLSRLLAEALARLSPEDLRAFHGPRRVAVAANVAAAVPETRTAERGPRSNAPEQALAGFLRKHGAARDQLVREGDYWVLQKVAPAQDAASVIAEALPAMLRRFPWPKSMRWGGTSAFTWVRPLRRIVCLLDGELVRFELRDGNDDAHSLSSGRETEAHRFLAPGAVAVFGLADWKAKLRARYVIAEAEERGRMIRDGIRALAAARGLEVVEDAGLLDEIAGLVEWPVPLLGRIDAAFMDLPPEVMQVSMRVNQRYFALRYPDGSGSSKNPDDDLERPGSAAPWFAFVANIEAADGGAAVVAGNERVLRARFADARHFWDQDRKVPLESRVPALDGITFHAKLGSQGERVRRIMRLARMIAPMVGADELLAERAALLAKADLTAGMVVEFPELQGVMGRYYALHDGEPPEVAEAIRDHYAPKGPSDSVPDAPVSIAVALADKLDALAQLFAVGEKPTGSGDPFGLRRAALGIIRIIRENALRLRLADLIADALPQGMRNPPLYEILAFIIERLRIHVREEGHRHDVIAAIFAAQTAQQIHDDIVSLLARTNAVTALLDTEIGADLLIAYRRANNIIQIENRKDGPHTGEPDRSLFRTSEEKDLAGALSDAQQAIDDALSREKYQLVLPIFAGFRHPVDVFFDKVTVNAPEPELRRNRLRLLARLRDTMNRVADFSKIEG